MSKARNWKRAIDELAAEYGCTVEHTKGSHYKITHPDGWFVFASRTPSDARALRHVRSDLHRKANGVWR